VEQRGFKLIPHTSHYCFDYREAYGHCPRQTRWHVTRSVKMLTAGAIAFGKPTKIHAVVPYVAGVFEHSIATDARVCRHSIVEQPPVRAVAERL
jgi:hypothetical protein